MAGLIPSRDASQMTIRQAGSGDIAALSELFLEARLTAFHWANPGSFLPEDFEVQTAGEVIHVAEGEAGELQGFISVWEEDNFVHHLFVAPCHKRKGIGRALLQELAARRRGPFTLKCTSANCDALGFYRKLGWTEISTGVAEEGAYILLEWRPSLSGSQS